MAFVAIVAAVISAASAIQQGRAAKANATSAANMNDYNARVADTNAVTARQQATANEESQRRQAAIQLGRQRAGTAEAGGGLAGTSGDLYGQSLATADLDAKNILYMGDLRGQGLNIEGELQRNGASRARTNASAAMPAAYLSAAGAAFSGASNYMSLSRMGGS